MKKKIQVERIQYKSYKTWFKVIAFILVQAFVLTGTPLSYAAFSNSETISKSTLAPHININTDSLRIIIDRLLSEYSGLLNAALSVRREQRKASAGREKVVISAQIVGEKFLRIGAVVFDEDGNFVKVVENEVISRTFSSGITNLKEYRENEDIKFIKAHLRERLAKEGYEISVVEGITNPTRAEDKKEEPKKSTKSKSTLMGLLLLPIAVVLLATEGFTATSFSDIISKVGGTDIGFYIAAIAVGIFSIIGLGRVLRGLFSSKGKTTGIIPSVSPYFSPEFANWVFRASARNEIKKAYQTAGGIVSSFGHRPESQIELDYVGFRLRTKSQLDTFANTLLVMFDTKLQNAFVRNKRRTYVFKLQKPIVLDKDYGKVDTIEISAPADKQQEGDLGVHYGYRFIGNLGKLFDNIKKREGFAGFDAEILRETARQKKSEFKVSGTSFFRENDKQIIEFRSKRLVNAYAKSETGKGRILSLINKLPLAVLFVLTFTNISFAAQTPEYFQSINDRGIIGIVIGIISYAAFIIHRLIKHNLRIGQVRKRYEAELDKYESEIADAGPLKEPPVKPDALTKTERNRGMNLFVKFAVLFSAVGIGMFMPEVALSAVDEIQQSSQNNAAGYVQIASQVIFIGILVYIAILQNRTGKNLGEIGENVGVIKKNYNRLSTLISKARKRLGSLSILLIAASVIALSALMQKTVPNMTDNWQWIAGAFGAFALSTIFGDFGTEEEEVTLQDAYERIQQDILFVAGQELSADDEKDLFEQVFENYEFAGSLKQEVTNLDTLRDFWNGILTQEKGKPESEQILRVERLAGGKLRFSLYNLHQTIQLTAYQNEEAWLEQTTKIINDLVDRFGGNIFDKLDEINEQNVGNLTGLVGTPGYDMVIRDTATEEAIAAYWNSVKKGEWNVLIPAGGDATRLGLGVAKVLLDLKELLSPVSEESLEAAFQKALSKKEPEITQEQIETIRKLKLRVNDLRSITILGRILEAKAGGLTAEERAKQTITLTCTKGDQEKIAQELYENNYYGFSHASFIIQPQGKNPTFKIKDGKLSIAEGIVKAGGNGVPLVEATLPEKAYMIGVNGRLVKLEVSALEHARQRGAKYVLQNTIGDLRPWVDSPWHAGFAAVVHQRLANGEIAAAAEYVKQNPELPQKGGTVTYNTQTGKLEFREKMGMGELLDRVSFEEQPLATFNHIFDIEKFIDIASQSLPVYIKKGDNDAEGNPTIFTELVGGDLLGVIQQLGHAVVHVERQMKIQELKVTASLIPTVNEALKQDALESAPPIVIGDKRFQKEFEIELVVSPIRSAI